MDEPRSTGTTQCIYIMYTTPLQVHLKLHDVLSQINIVEHTSSNPSCLSGCIFYRLLTVFTRWSLSACLLYFLQAIDSIHQVGVYCLALVPANTMPKAPLGGIHIAETKQRFLEGALHPCNVLMCPHSCVTNLPKPRQKQPGRMELFIQGSKMCHWLCPNVLQAYCSGPTVRTIYCSEPTVRTTRLFRTYCRTIYW